MHNFKVEKIVNEKYKIANLLTKGLKKLKYIKTLEEKKNCSYSYYMYPLQLDCKLEKRNLIVNDLKKLKISVEEDFIIYINFHYINILAFFIKEIPCEFSKKNHTTKMPCG